MKTECGHFEPRDVSFAFLLGVAFASVIWLLVIASFA